MLIFSLPQHVRPATSFALIQELVFRDALRIALQGRDETSLEPILAFCLRHIIDPRFGELAGSVVGIIIGELAATSLYGLACLGVVS